MNPLHNSPRLVDLYNKYSYKMEITEKMKATKKKITVAHSIMQLDELKCRKRVLRRLGFISDTDIVQLKARLVTPDVIGIMAVTDVSTELPVKSAPGTNCCLASCCSTGCSTSLVLS